MPFIEQNQLVKLYNEIDDLSDKETELRKGYIDLKLENTAVLKREKRKTKIIGLLSAIILVLAFLVYQSKSKVKEEAKKHMLLKEKSDSIVNTTSASPARKLIYAVQVGVFKNLEIDEPGSSGFKKVQSKNGLYTYVIGEFSSYRQATLFKNQIVQLGIKDAFIVAYYEGDKIEIQDALEISDELELAN